jgi:hypothetical protein
MLAMIEKCSRVIDATDPPFDDFASYVARTAHNVASNEIRPPNWTRLSNRLRRALSKHEALDHWDDPQLGPVAGYAGWRAKQQSGSMPKLRQVLGQLRAEPALNKPWTQITSEDWGHLLEQAFTAAAGPLPMGRVVAFMAELVDIRVEVPPEPEPGTGTGEHAPSPEPPAPQPSLQESALLREELAQLWSCIRGLRREWRITYILNPPSYTPPKKPATLGGVPAARTRASGRSTARGDIEVLVRHDVASHSAILAALELTAAEQAALRKALSLSRDAGEQFDADGGVSLFDHLPLPDKKIGEVLGKSGMQVLGLRAKAMGQLAECMVRARE